MQPRSLMQTRVVTLVAVALVLVLGFASGMAYARIVQARELRALLEGEPGQLEARAKLALLVRTLDLDDAQRTSVRAILIRAGEESREARLPVEPRLAEIRVRERHDIREVLRDDQRALYDRGTRGVDDAMGRTTPSP